MTTIGDALWKYISEQDKQAALAHRWLELWCERYPKKTHWQPATIESHFSRLKKSDPQGVRFFFDEAARADLLFEVLNVPASEHARIRALAEKVLQPDPRVVVDISTWPGRGDPLEALFDELERKVLRDCPLQPIVLVLTEQQWAKLPRNYDEFRTLQVRRVATPGDGQAAAIELAGDGALVFAPWQFDPFERWLAAEFDSNALSFEPDDGLAVFAELGTLPSIPAVEHRLEEICEPTKDRFSIDRLTPTARRWWQYTLASEERTAEALEVHDGVRLPAKRLAFAQQLGVAATSTARERLDHELDQLSARLREALGVPVEVLDPAAHGERLARAALRPTPIAAWRCRDTIHLLHADSPIQHPRIEVHRPVPTVPALTRLLQHMSDWSVYDHEADPSLARAVETLDPEGSERPAFLHARATVQWNDLRPMPPPAQRCERWADELRAVLALDPPPASLRLRPESGNECVDNYFTFESDELLAGVLKSPSDLLVRPRGRRTIIADRERTVLRVEGSLRDPGTLSIDKSLNDSVEVEVRRDRIYDRRARIFADPEDAGYGWKDLPELWLPVLASQALDADLWLDCVERSCGLATWKWEHSERCEKLLRTTGRSRISLLEIDKVRGEALKIEAGTWIDADRFLALCWLALRVALERPLAVQMADGVVCSLGAGMCAHLAVHARPSGSPPGVVAAFDATVKGRDVKLDVCTRWTHTANVGGNAAEFGVRVPAHMVLQTPAFSASITFLASPFFQVSMPAAIMGVLGNLETQVI